MKNILDESNIYEKCTGCRTCENVCIKKCIQLVEDEEGFLYPIIDSQKCVNCGICVKKCHVLQEFPKSDIKELEGYCAWNDDKKRLCSSSGGVFSAIIDSLKDENAVIYGAAFAEDWKSVHHVKCTKSNYSILRKSKYVYSDLEKVFITIKKELSAGKNVLFSGTPCQVAALKTYLGEFPDNLITIDMICHGVPATKLYREHLDYIAQGRDIVLVDFRPKGYGWNVRMKVAFDNGNVYNVDQAHDWYLYNYFANRTMRKCCYECRYADSNHQSDITLADFWKVDKYKTEYLKEPGVGLVICNNQRGSNIVNKLELANLEKLDQDYFLYAFNKGHEWYSKDERNDFFNALRKNGINCLERKLKIKNLPWDIARKIKKLLIH